MKMNNAFFHSVILFGFLTTVSVGCGHKSSPPTTQAESTSTQVSGKSGQQNSPEAYGPGPSLEQNVADATAAWKNGDYNQAVIKFHDTQKNSPMSGQQLIELNATIAKTMTDLYARAAKGDVQAKAAIAEYDRLRNRR